MQEQILECIAAMGRDGKTVVAVAVTEQYKGVICLFDRSLSATPEVGKTIYTYNYEIRSRTVEGKERKYGIIYSWHYKKEDAEEELKRYKQKMAEEKLEKSVREAVEFARRLSIDEEDKKAIEKLVREGVKPSHMKSVDVLFYDADTRTGQVYLGVCSGGQVYKHPPGTDLFYVGAVWVGDGVLRVSQTEESMANIVRLVKAVEPDARVYQVKDAELGHVTAYIAVDSREKRELAEKAVKAYEELIKLNLLQHEREPILAKIEDMLRRLAKRVETREREKAEVSV